MAFVMEFGTGFEMGQMPTRAGVFTWAGATVNTASPHSGTYSLSAGSLSQQWRVKCPAPAAEKYISVWVRAGSDRTGAWALQLLDADNNILVELERSGTNLHAFVGASQVATGTVDWDDLSYHHVQAHVVVGAEGRIETIIDGIPDIDYSGDTQPGAKADITYMLHNKPHNVTGGWRIDDFCFGTGGWPGDIRFDAVLLDGDDTVAWTPSTGTDNYALLDEVPPSSTDYVSTTVDASDLYTLAPWDDTDGSGNVVKDPIAVTLWVDARKEDGNYNDLLRLNMQDGGNTVQGGYETLLTSYEHRWFQRLLAPDDGEWTKAKIDALLVGIDAEME